MKRLAAGLLLLVTLAPARAIASDPVQGWASTWGGPVAASPDCVYPWTHCAPRRVTSLVTGVQIIVTPAMYCLCEVPGTPHPHRLIDLTAGQVAALGLPPDSMYSVSVQLLGPSTPLLPNTAYQP